MPPTRLSEAVETYLHYRRREHARPEREEEPPQETHQHTT